MCLFDRVVNVACSPTESVFVSASVNAQNQGKLLLYDIKTKKLEVNKLNQMFIQIFSVLFFIAYKSPS